MWQSAAMFKLHTSVLRSGYCCLPVSLNQSGYSPVTSTKHFRPENSRSLDIFSFFGLLSVNHGVGGVGKIPAGQQFLKCTDQLGF